MFIIIRMFSIFLLLLKRLWWMGVRKSIDSRKGCNLSKSNLTGPPNYYSSPRTLFSLLRICGSLAAHFMKDLGRKCAGKRVFHFFYSFLTGRLLRSSCEGRNYILRIRVDLSFFLYIAIDFVDQCDHIFNHSINKLFFKSYKLWATLFRRHFILSHR